MNWKYNQDKALGILTREYGIKPAEALTAYSEDQIQLLLSQLPTERVLSNTRGLSKIELENRYLSQFMDRDVEAVKTSQEITELRDQRANLKAQLRKDINNKQLQKQIKQLTDKINSV